MWTHVGRPQRSRANPLFSLELAFLLFAITVVGIPQRTSGQVVFEGPELLGRPTDTSITLNVVTDKAVRAYFAYGTESGNYTGQTSAKQVPANIPIEETLSGLQADTIYYYRMLYCEVGVFCSPGSETWLERAEHTFRTQRPRGSSFTFTITTDSHVGWPWFMDSGLYEQTMLNAIDDDPDFHIDLGDTFTMDSGFGNPSVDAQRAREVYLEQRHYFGLISHSVPVFLAIGNHENEEGWNLDDAADPASGVPILSSNARKQYYLNPVPDGFYTGNTDDSCTYCQYIDDDRLRENYYAWEWGDALFIVLDPFWYTPTKPFEGTLGGEENDETIGNNWDWTLGEQQYLWLKQTLEQSTAPLKFIFSHHVTGGALAEQHYGYGRGGAEAVPYFEWGGHNADGSWGWDDHRPGWYAPVHQVMIENDVTAFFHGHDHVFAREKIHGIIYQECPRADDGNYETGFDYYDPAIMVANSGHIRVVVSPTGATVEYVRSFLPGEGPNGNVAHSETIPGATGGIAPVAIDQSTNTNEDTPIDITPTVDDADDYLLSFTVVAQPTHGIATPIPGNAITYAPSPNWSGTDAFVYEVTDHDGQTSAATISVVVTPINDGPPNAINDSAALDEDISATIQVLANDAVADLPATISILSGPSHGTAVINADNSITYNPTSDWNGSDSFTYRVQDFDGQTDTATVGLTVNPVSDGPPVAVDDSATLDEDTSVTLNILANDTVADLLATVSIIATPCHGTAVVNADNSISYTPKGEWNGSDSFVYRVEDLDGQIASATVSISVSAVDDGPPNAIDDSVTLDEDSSVAIDVLANDTVWDEPARVAVFLQPDHGTAFANTDGTITYTPDSNWNGLDGFTYEIEDLDLQTHTANVYLSVVASDDGVPIANDDATTLDEDTSATLNVLANDTVADLPATILVIAAPSHGTATVNADNSITYTPTSGWNGSDTFTYRVQDLDEQTDTATVNLTVTPDTRIGEVSNLTVLSDGSGQLLSWTNTSLPGAPHDGIVVFRSTAPAVPGFPTDGVDYAGNPAALYAHSGSSTVDSITDPEIGTFNYRVCNHDPNFIYSNCNTGFWNNQGWIDSVVAPASGWSHNVGGQMLLIPGVIPGGNVGIVSNSPAASILDGATGHKTFSAVSLSALPSVGSPMAQLDNGRNILFVAKQNGSINAIDVDSGLSFWSTSLPGEAFVAGISGILYRNASATFQANYSHDLLFVASTTGNLLAIDAFTGSTLWSVNAGAPIRARPSYDTNLNTLFVPTDGNGILAYNLDPSDELGTLPVPASGWTNPGGSFSLNCTGRYDTQDLACADRSGNILLLDRPTGTVIASGGSGLSSPSSIRQILDGVIVSSASSVVRLDASGTSLVNGGSWTPGIILSPALIFQSVDAIYVGGSDKALHKLALTTLTESDLVAVESQSPMALLGSPNYDVLNDFFIFGSSDGHIWAVDYF